MPDPARGEAAADVARGRDEPEEPLALQRRQAVVRRQSGAQFNWKIEISIAFSIEFLVLHSTKKIQLKTQLIFQLRFQFLYWITPLDGGVERVRLEQRDLQVGRRMRHRAAVIALLGQHGGPVAGGRHLGKARDYLEQGISSSSYDLACFLL